MATTPRAKAKEKPISRIEDRRRKMGNKTWTPPLPSVAWVGHLVGYLFEVGPLGAEQAPISHTEIAAWCALTGIVLRPWEVRFLRRMSADYLQQVRAAEDPDCPEPWPQELPQEIKNAAVKALRSAIRASAGKT